MMAEVTKREGKDRMIARCTQGRFGLAGCIIDGWVYYGIMANVMELGIPRPGIGFATEHFENRR